MKVRLLSLLLWAASTFQRGEERVALVGLAREVNALARVPGRRGPTVAR